MNILDRKYANMNIFIQLRMTLGLLAVSSLLAACAAPIRTNPNDFKLVSSGKIQLGKVDLFADCLADGLSEALVTTTYTFRQTHRANGVRVEQLANSYIGMSADVNNDGSVAFYESTAMKLVDTKPEIKVFEICIDRYK